MKVAVIRLDQSCRFNWTVIYQPRLWRCFFFGHRRVEGWPVNLYFAKVHVKTRLELTRHRMEIAVPYCTRCNNILTHSQDVATRMSDQFDYKILELQPLL